MTDPNINIPKKIGNFNIPKTVIECKVDTLAFLEILLRKNLVSWEEIEEIREAVVMHMNIMYPELQLSYSSPPPLKDQAPFPVEEKKPLFYSAPPPELAGQTIPAPTATPNAEPAVATEAPKPQANTASPLYASSINQPRITNAMKPGERPMTSPPRSMSNTPPRKKI